MATPTTDRATRRRSVVTVGTYDGVHLGHRRLIAAAREFAATSSCEAVVVTFDRHPSEILRPQSPVPLLTSEAHKLELIAATGIDHTVVLRFDARRAAESAEEFVSQVLVEELGAQAVLVGSNFRFGRGRLGDIELLDKMGADHGFTALGVDLVLDDETHTVVSSSRIRGLIGDGELDEAARLLGRPHEVRGRFHSRDETLELAAEANVLLPPPGRYVARVGPVHAAGAAVEIEVRSEPDGRAIVVIPRPAMALLAGDLGTGRCSVTFGDADPLGPDPLGPDPLGPDPLGARAPVD